MSTLFFILGITFLIIGIIGIFTPILPTTPFLLLAAILFSKSSPTKGWRCRCLYGYKRWKDLRSITQPIWNPTTNSRALRLPGPYHEYGYWSARCDC